MNTTVISSAPVIVASPEAQHPVARNKKSMQGIGITGILIGLYTAGLGLYYIAHSQDVTEYQTTVYSYSWMLVGAAAWFIVAGSLAVAAGCSPTRCHITAGIVLAILACLAAFGTAAREATVVFTLVTYCSEYCGYIAGSIFAHALLLVLAIVEFVLTIVHASFCCACCGRGPPTQVQTAMAVTATTYGKGYAPLHNEEVGYATAYPPQKTAGGPPAYY